MTQEQLKAMIESELLGAKYDPNLNAFALLKKARELFPQYAKDLTDNYEGNCVYVRYRGYGLIGARLHKVKGVYKGHYFGYDWKIKSIEVFDWLTDYKLTDYKQRFDYINNIIKTSEKIKAEKEQEKIANFKKVRALFPALDWWHFEELLKGVISVSYDQIKKENGTDENNK